MTAAVDDLAQDGLPPLVVAGAALDPARLRLSGARIALEPIERAWPGLERAAAEADAAYCRVDALTGLWLPGPVGQAVEDLRDELADVVDATTDGARAARLIPPMLGAEGTRRYFMGFQTNAEARGTSGLIGAFGILTARNGRIKIARLRSTREPKNYPQPAACSDSIHGRDRGHRSSREQIDRVYGRSSA